MEHENKDTLREELEQFQAEKEYIRNIVGQIGGKNSSRKEHIINTIFIVAVFSLFMLDIIHYVFNINFFISPANSLEIAMLLISMKIIWMMYKSSKVEHFQFWVLSSIEFRLNDISSRIKKIEKTLIKSDPPSHTTSKNNKRL